MINQNACLYDHTDEDDLQVVREACIALQRGSKDDIQHLSRLIRAGNLRDVPGFFSDPRVLSHLLSLLARSLEQYDKELASQEQLPSSSNLPVILPGGVSMLTAGTTDAPSSVSNGVRVTKGKLTPKPRTALSTASSDTPLAPDRVFGYRARRKDGEEEEDRGWNAVALVYGVIIGYIRTAEVLQCWDATPMLPPNSGRSDTFLEAQRESLVTESKDVSFLQKCRSKRVRVTTSVYTMPPLHTRTHKTNTTVIAQRDHNSSVGGGNGAGNVGVGGAVGVAKSNANANGTSGGAVDDGRRGQRPTEPTGGWSGHAEVEREAEGEEEVGKEETRDSKRMWSSNGEEGTSGCTCQWLWAPPENLAEFPASDSRKGNPGFSCGTVVDGMSSPCVSVKPLTPALLSLLLKRCIPRVQPSSELYSHIRRDYLEYIRNSTFSGRNTQNLDSVDNESPGSSELEEDSFSHAKFPISSGLSDTLVQRMGFKKSGTGAYTLTSAPHRPLGGGFGLSNSSVGNFPHVGKKSASRMGVPDIYKLGAHAGPMEKGWLQQVTDIVHSGMLAFGNSSFSESGLKSISETRKKHHIPILPVKPQQILKNQVSEFSNSSTGNGGMSLFGVDLSNDGNFGIEDRELSLLFSLMHSLYNVHILSQEEEEEEQWLEEEADEEESDDMYSDSIPGISALSPPPPSSSSSSLSSLSSLAASRTCAPASPTITTTTTATAATSNVYKNSQVSKPCASTSFYSKNAESQTKLPDSRDPPLSWRSVLRILITQTLHLWWERCQGHAFATPTNTTSSSYSPFASFSSSLPLSSLSSGSSASIPIHPLTGKTTPGILSEHISRKTDVDGNLSWAKLSAQSLSLLTALVEECPLRVYRRLFRDYIRYVLLRCLTIDSICGENNRDVLNVILFSWERLCQQALVRDPALLPLLYCAIARELRDVGASRGVPLLQMLEGVVRVWMRREREMEMGAAGSEAELREDVLNPSASPPLSSSSLPSSSATSPTTSTTSTTSSASTSASARSPALPASFWDLLVHILSSPNSTLNEQLLQWWKQDWFTQYTVKNAPKWFFLAVANLWNESHWNTTVMKMRGNVLKTFVSSSHILCTRFDTNFSKKTSTHLENPGKSIEILENASKDTSFYSTCFFSELNHALRSVHAQLGTTDGKKFRNIVSETSFSCSSPSSFSASVSSPDKSSESPPHDSGEICRSPSHSAEVCCLSVLAGTMTAAEPDIRDYWTVMADTKCILPAPLPALAYSSLVLARALGAGALGVVWEALIAEQQRSRSQWRKCAAKIWAHHLLSMTTLDDNHAMTTICKDMTTIDENMLTKQSAKASLPPSTTSTTTTSSSSSSSSSVSSTLSTSLHTAPAATPAAAAMSVTPFNHSRDAITRELAALALTSHPLVCSLLGATRGPGCSILLLECGKNDLLSVLNQGLTSGQIGFLLAELLYSLSYLHGLGISHGDIKPDNILIMNSGHLKLLDLGMVTLHTIPNTTRKTEESRNMEVPESSSGKDSFPFAIPENLHKEIPESYLSQWLTPHEFPSPIPLHLPLLPTPPRPPPSIHLTPLARLQATLSSLRLPSPPPLPHIVTALLPPPRGAHIGTAAYLPPEAVWCKLVHVLRANTLDSTPPHPHSLSLSCPAASSPSPSPSAASAHYHYHPYPPGDLWAVGCILYISCCRRMHIQPKGSAELYRLSTISAAAYKSLLGKGSSQIKKDNLHKHDSGISVTKEKMEESGLESEEEVETVLRRGKKDGNVPFSGRKLLPKDPRLQPKNSLSHAHFTSFSENSPMSTFPISPHSQSSSVLDYVYEHHYPLPAILPKLSPDDAVSAQVLDWRPDPLPKTHLISKKIVFGLLHPLPWMRYGVIPYTHQCRNSGKSSHISGIDHVQAFIRNSNPEAKNPENTPYLGDSPYSGSEICQDLEICACCTIPTEVFYIPYTPYTQQYLYTHMSMIHSKYMEYSSNINDTNLDTISRTYDSIPELDKAVFSQYTSIRTSCGIGMGTANIHGGLYKVDYSLLLSDPWLASVLAPYNDVLVHGQAAAAPTATATATTGAGATTTFVHTTAASTETTSVSTATIPLHSPPLTSPSAACPPTLPGPHPHSPHLPLAPALSPALPPPATLHLSQHAAATRLLASKSPIIVADSVASDQTWARRHNSMMLSPMPAPTALDTRYLPLPVDDLIERHRHMPAEDITEGNPHGSGPLPVGLIAGDEDGRDKQVCIDDIRGRRRQAEEEEEEEEEVADDCTCGDCAHINIWGGRMPIAPEKESGKTIIEESSQNLLSGILPSPGSHAPSLPPSSASTCLSTATSISGPPSSRSTPQTVVKPCLGRRTPTTSSSSSSSPSPTPAPTDTATAATAAATYTNTPAVIATGTSLLSSSENRYASEKTSFQPRFSEITPNSLHNVSVLDLTAPHQQSTLPSPRSTQPQPRPRNQLQKPLPTQPVSKLGGQGEEQGESEGEEEEEEDVDAGGGWGMGPVRERVQPWNMDYTVTSDHYAATSAPCAAADGHYTARTTSAGAGAALGAASGANMRTVGGAGAPLPPRANVKRGSELGISRLSDGQPRPFVPDASPLSGIPGYSRSSSFIPNASPLVGVNLTGVRHKGSPLGIGLGTGTGMRLSHASERGSLASQFSHATHTTSARSILPRTDINTVGTSGAGVGTNVVEDVGMMDASVTGRSSHVDGVSPTTSNVTSNSYSTPSPQDAKPNGVLIGDGSPHHVLSSGLSADNGASAAKNAMREMMRRRREESSFALTNKKQ